MLALQQVPTTEVALSNIMAVKQFKLFVAVPDGEMWRWRVSWPYNPGKCGMTSKESFATRQAAEWAAHVISGFERPSAVMVGAFSNVSVDAGLPAEVRTDWVNDERILEFNHHPYPSVPWLGYLPSLQ